MTLFLQLGIRRLFQFLLSLFCIITMTFFLMKALPGNPFLEEQAVPKEILDSLYRYYGLDEPLFSQYIKYLKGVLSLDLGPSFKFEGRCVSDIIKKSFPISFTIGFLALIFSVVSGLIIGTLSAQYRGKWQDQFLNFFSTIGISIPSFLLATLLQYFLALKWNLLPLARWGDLSHAVLPALSLSFLPMAFVARLTRSQMIEVLEQDYILFSRSKGLSNYQIVKNHLLKNALLPVITYIGHLSASILTGSFVIEKIFGIPGLGFWFVNSIANRDYTVIMGLTIFYSFMVMFMIFLVDLAYIILDPRIATKVEATYDS